MQNNISSIIDCAQIGCRQQLIWIETTAAKCLSDTFRKYLKHKRLKLGGGQAYDLSSV
jgi:hypothetical protein